jgi:hypothetical protein
MLPCHEGLLLKPVKCGAFHSFLVSEYENLSLVFNQNILKLQKLNKILSTLEEDEKSSSSVQPSDSFLSNPLESILNKPSNSELVICSRFPEFVCKSKYFSLTAKLNTNDLVIGPEFSFIVVAFLYSAEATPKKIRHAMNGRNIFRGNTRAVLAFEPETGQHQVEFKLQVKEVSSHFPSGVFHLVFEVEESEDCPQLIVKPLVIQNLRVRAKEYYVDLIK